MNGGDPAEIMKCYAPEQLPVLNALAREFVVCDNWFSSLPGPTWPNRMFVHAASSGGLDHSPTTLEIAEWEALSGFGFANGTIFDRLNSRGIRRRLYAGDDFPVVAALKGIHLDDVRHYSLFANDLKQPNYADRYIFIEPAYDVLHDYRGGTSQHPLADITRGEALIKATYEAIRNSPVWPTSLLIITWDEHGGFFDHVAPPNAQPPDDSTLDDPFNVNGFTFDQYGVRVPAIVISPLIAKNVIDHRRYDHSSIPATLEALFGLQALTQRDSEANRLDALVTLVRRAAMLPRNCRRRPIRASRFPPLRRHRRTCRPPRSTRPADTVNEGNLPSMVHRHAAGPGGLASGGTRPAIVDRVASIETRGQAAEYMKEVQAKVRPLKAVSGQ